MEVHVAHLIQERLGDLVSRGEPGADGLAELFVGEGRPLFRVDLVQDGLIKNLYTLLLTD
ncbi:hypothetical protein [Kibdelosporangium aridum]|uniref:hypothetical protein n=1 Tax=Kibdelosporangium aridum TaxID=2030 RepID=UPI0009FE0504|nr:hypothetical protein [Kibdelosporangium aridum]